MDLLEEQIHWKPSGFWDPFQRTENRFSARAACSVCS